MGKSFKHKFNRELVTAGVIWGFFWWYFMSLSPAYLVTYGQSTMLVNLGLAGGNMDTPIFGGLLRFIHGLSGLPLTGYSLGYFFSAGLASFGLGLFFVWLSRWEEHLVVRHRPLALGLKLMAVVALSQTITFKIQAVFVERYMPVGVLLLASWLMAEKLFTAGKNRGLLILYSLVIATGLTMHWSFGVVALITTLAWYGKPAREKMSRLTGWPLIWLVGVVVMAGGMALTWRFADLPRHSYIAPATLAEMVSAYGRTYFNDGWSQEFSLNPAEFGSTALWLWGDFGRMIGGWSLGLGMLGILTILAKRLVFWRWYLLSFGLTLIVPVVGFSSLTAKPEMGQLFPLLWLLYWMGFVWCFVSILVDRVYKGLSVLHRPERVLFGMLAVLGILMSSWLIMGRRLPMHSVDEEKMVLALADQLPDKAILLCFDNSLCQSAIYTVTAHALTDKLTVIPYDYHPDTYVLEVENFRPFGYRQYPYILHEILADALSDGVPVFSLGMSNDYWRFLGFDLGIVHYISRGDFGELALETPKDWPPQPALAVKLTKNRLGSRLVSPVLMKLIDARVIGAMVDFRSDRYEQGYDAMNTTASVAWQLPESEFRQFLTTRAEVESLVHNSLFSQGEVRETGDDLLKAVPFLVERGLYNRAVELCRGALMLEPGNKAIRLRVAEYYEQLELLDLAQIERLNAAKLAD